MSEQLNLLKTSRFLPLFVTQFMGALNDNMIKNALVVLLAFNAAQWTNMKLDMLTNLASGLFILPFFLFSATAGQMADKYDKATLARWVKALEVVIIVLAGVGFYWHRLDILLAALFLLGFQSTLFGPIKYSILPQHLHTHELIGGNALIEAGTFVSILIGTLMGGMLAGIGEQSVAWITGLGLVIAALGLLASWKIPTAPAPAPELKLEANFLRETWRTINHARHNTTVFQSILGASWFWLYGAILLAQFPAYAKVHLSGSESAVTLLLATFTVGIGLGSMLCERLSQGRIELGLVPFGAIGLSLFGLDFAWASPDSGALIPLLADAQATAPLTAMQLLGYANVWRVLIDLFCIGLFSGFFIVPLYALIQQRSQESERARIIAANNIMNALFMVVGAIGAAALLNAGLSIPWLFAVVAVMNALVALYIFKLVPEFLMRFVFWLLVHTLYRIEAKDAQHLPKSGAALLVCNHVSFVDALIISAISPRPIRFIMDHQIFRLPVLSYVFRKGRAIPIASARDDAALMEQAFTTAAEALKNEELVCIFPEGRLTRDGEMSEFRTGYQQIFARLGDAQQNINIVPMALSGLWQSLFARRSEKGWRRYTINALFKPVRLHVGANVPPTINPVELRQVVETLRGSWR